MKQMFEILIPLVLIIVLLMCMMNNNTEEAFSVGGVCKNEGFTPWSKPSDSNSDSNTSKDQCKVTMVWADWCGFSKKSNKNDLKYMFCELMNHHDVNLSPKLSK